MRFLSPVVTAAALLALAPGSAAQFFGPSVLASIGDNSPLGGTGEFFNQGLFNGLVRKLSSVEDRAIQEFDVAPLVGKTLISAQLSGVVSVNNSLDTGVRTFDFVFYAGNGAADLSDFQAQGTLVGTGSYYPPTDQSFSFSFDVTAALQSVLGSGATHAGLLCVPTSFPNAPNVLAPYTSLVVQTVEPSSAPFWTVQTGDTQIASAKLADLDGDGTDEIVLTTGSKSSPATGTLHVWRGGGSPLPGFPVALPKPAHHTPAIGDLDGDGDREIVTVQSSVVDVFDHTGAQVPGWNKTLAPQAATMADVDGDGMPEVVVSRGSSSMISYEHDGTQKTSYSIPGVSGTSAPAVGDLDLDGDLEIVARGSGKTCAWDGDGTVLPSFPVTTCGSTSKRPVVADLDVDGTLEIVVGSSCLSDLWVLDHLGAAEPGWPQSADIGQHDPPTVTDLDGDGDLEVLAHGFSSSAQTARIFALHHDGAAVSGFPADLQNPKPSNGRSACVTGDIDADGLPEIVVQAGNSIFAVDSSGATLPGYPFLLAAPVVTSTSSPAPAIGDPDGDGLIELVAVASSDLVTVLQLQSPHSPFLTPWPTDGRDAGNRSLYGSLPLSVSPHTLSVATGGTVGLTLSLDASQAGRIYLLLASASGTSPGIPLPDGPGALPLNPDATLVFTLTEANSPTLPGFFGALDAAGQASAGIVAPGSLPVGLAGKNIDLAFVLALPFDFASNPVSVLFTP